MASTNIRVFHKTTKTRIQQYGDTVFSIGVDGITVPKGGFSVTAEKENGVRYIVGQISCYVLTLHDFFGRIDFGKDADAVAFAKAFAECDEGGYSTHLSTRFLDVQAEGEEIKVTKWEPISLGLSFNK